MDQYETFVGVVHQMQVEGPWGIVQWGEDGYGWFHESVLVDEERVVQAGEAVEFDAVHHDDPERWQVIAFRSPRAAEPEITVDPAPPPLDSRKPLYRFAAMGPEETWLTRLAEKAQDEDWTYRFTPNSCTRPILRSYLEDTYARLVEESGQVEDEKKKVQFGDEDGRSFACFNTGLVTDHQEQIFALFGENRDPRADAPFRLDGFYSESERPLLGTFTRLPEPAKYFDDPAVLLYDRRCELVIDTEHIVDERLDRFPESARSDKHVALQLLQSARRSTERRVHRNYKAAIPQFSRGEVQLLLPLCLVEPDKADLALIVTRYGDQYKGSTAITLDMAYNNARLLAKPDTDWLQP